MTKLEMVAGFLINKKLKEVLLVEKKSPSWQAGLLNGIGGKIEGGESPMMAMCREIVEETTIKDAYPWRLFCVEVGRDYVVYFFVAFVDEFPEHAERNDVDENLVTVSLGDIANMQSIVGNLKWLVPMACDWREIREVIMHVEHADIRERPTW